MEATPAHDAPRLLISRSALLHNAKLIRRAAPAARVCAMIKADAYGHDASLVADALCNFGQNADDLPQADQLAVATLEEAEQLPELFVPVLVLRPVENAFVGKSRQQLEAAVRAGWILTVRTIAAANDLSRIAIHAGKRAIVHVMVDTGMTRCGATLDTLSELLSRIDALPSLKLTQLSTHFANSEVAGNPYNDEQLALFRAATDAYVASRPGRVLRHVANSGGIFNSPDAHLDMVRPGISLYGIDAACRPHMDRHLKPVMKWTAPLIGIHDITAGRSVGYNQSWRATRDTRVGLVPVGYADGYMRALGGVASMLINADVPNQRAIACPVVGRVSMDLTTIDLTAAPHARVGDEITLLDNDPLSICSAYTLAKQANTIPYELFTRIGPRIKRIAVDPIDSPSPETTRV